MKVYEYPSREIWDQILTRPAISLESLESIVKPVLSAVKEGGDKAIFELTAKFDKVSLNTLLVSDGEFEEAIGLVDDILKRAIQLAYSNIDKFHTSQKEEVTLVETMPGVSCWRKSIAIQKVGLYIPGGTAPLFSTVLMLGVPAKIAGCEELILCTPPSKDGKIHPAILYTAHLLGISKVYKVGGAQAIAAMAYGTESISKVYKIFGPGNQYVTVAKQLVSRAGVAIDMPAGPSEVAVLADSTGDASFIAADLLSQAEHGIDSQVLFVSTEKSMLEKVEYELANQLEQLPRKKLAAKALENSTFILAKSLDEAMDIINAYAPEHLILQVNDVEVVASKVVNAGSVFMGNYTPEAAGDYASGTNHTLPTNGYARQYSGVSLDSFVKKVTFQHITKEGIDLIGPAIETMAASEELLAHKNAVSIRLNKKS
jgi:histidinol dehydrogenase